jgi:hypothetical protein
MLYPAETKEQSALKTMIDESKIHQTISESAKRDPPLFLTFIRQALRFGHAPRYYPILPNNATIIMGIDSPLAATLLTCPSPTMYILSG